MSNYVTFPAGSPSHTVTFPPAGQRPPRGSYSTKQKLGIAGAIVAGVVIVAITVETASSFSYSNGMWFGLKHFLDNEVQSYNRNLQVGNAQGMRTARARVEQLCQLAGTLKPGKSRDEAVVRGRCAEFGYPVPLQRANRNRLPWWFP